MKKIIYKLFFIKKTKSTEIFKVLGVFTTKENAKKAKEAFKKKPGFNLYPKSLTIFPEEIESTGWPEGFETIGEQKELKPAKQDKNLITEFKKIDRSPDMFSLYHIHNIDGHEDVKLCGNFLNKSKALKYKKFLSSKPGFKNAKNGFILQPYYENIYAFQKGIKISS